MDGIGKFGSFQAMNLGEHWLSRFSSNCWSCGFEYVGEGKRAKDKWNDEEDNFN